VGIEVRSNLFYGITYDIEEQEVPWGDDDWETWYAENFIDIGEPPPSATSLQYQNYYQQRYRLLEELPFEIRYHEECGYGVILAVKESCYTVDWEYHPYKALGKLNNVDQWDENLLKFCKKIGFTYKEPGWHLICEIS